MHAHVVVLTDHALEKDLSRGGWTEQRVFDRGTKTDNVGIVSLFTRTAPDARDDEERDATITIATSSSVLRHARLVVTFNGKTLSDRSIEVPANGDTTENVTLRGAGKLVAKVTPDDGKSDAIALDDEASLEEAVRKPPRVAVVRRKDDKSAASFFVMRALAAAGVTDDIQDLDIDRHPRRRTPRSRSSSPTVRRARRTSRPSSSASRPDGARSPAAAGRRRELPTSARCDRRSRSCAASRSTS